MGVKTQESLSNTEKLREEEGKNKIQFDTFNEWYNLLYIGPHILFFIFLGTCGKHNYLCGFILCMFIHSKGYLSNCLPWNFFPSFSSSADPRVLETSRMAETGVRCFKGKIKHTLLHTARESVWALGACFSLYYIFCISQRISLFIFSPKYWLDGIRRYVSATGNGERNLDNISALGEIWISWDQCQLE